MGEDSLRFQTLVRRPVVCISQVDVHGRGLSLDQIDEGSLPVDGCVTVPGLASVGGRPHDGVSLLLFQALSFRKAVSFLGVGQR